MESNVCLHDGVVIDIDNSRNDVFNRVKDEFGFDDIFVGDSKCSACRSLRFKNPTNSLKVAGVDRTMKVNQKRHRREQGESIEGSDVCTVPLSSFEDAHNA